MIRVFISSTFRDMHAERDVLNRVVFKELRSRCLKRGAEFIGLDLRWGVTEDEAEGEGALAICLREIERCRPFFVCLLGDRFGWVPPPEEVPALVYDAVRDEGVLPEVVAQWYRLDDTVEPPVYRLRREPGRKVPDDVAAALVRFWESRGLPGAGDSITAREILRGVFEDGYPATHALFYLRQSGIASDPAFPQAFVPVFAEQDADRRQRLADLRERINGLSGRMVVRDYTAGYAGLRIEPTLLPAGLSPDDLAAFGDGVAGPGDWPCLSRPVQEAVERHGTVALSGMEALAERILDDLWRAIEPELERPVARQDAHERERAYHERFVADRTRLFLGRGAELQKVLAYVGDVQDRRMLVVSGEPGAGKSAFMAEAVRLCRESHPGALVVPHFIGAAPDSAQLPATLRSLCETLRREVGIEEEVEADPLKLRNQLTSFLEKAGARRPVVLFLDALNQLDPTGRSHELDWLPFVLPLRTKLIASTLAGDCLDQLRRRVPEDHVVHVPALPKDDRRALVERFLEVRRKKLIHEQLDSLLDTSRRPDAGLPLYLLVALEELCLFGDYQALSERIDRLPERLPELFDQILARLEHDHGRATTESVCAWLAVSRSGLLESEVLDLLGREGPFPRIRWTRLYRALEPYLKPAEEATVTEHRGTGRLDFYHDQLRFAAFRRSLAMATSGAEATEPYRAAHRQLAVYFRSIAQDETQPGQWRTDRVRGLSELPYHQARGEMWEELERALCDLNFIAAKCAAGMTYDLVTDYDVALASLPEAREERGRQHQLDQRVARYTREMIEYARRWSEARDRHERDPARFPLPGPEDTPEPPPTVRVWTKDEIQADSDRIAIAPTRLDRVRAFGQFVSADSHALVRFSDRPGFCVQEAYNLGPLGPVVAAAEETVAGWRGPLILLRTEAFRLPSNLHPACLKTLEGHSGGVESVALTADGRRAVSGSEDNTLRIWDLQTGQCLKTLEGHTDWVLSVALTPDGWRAVSGGRDNILRVWDVETGQCLKTMEGHTDWVLSVALTPDGRRAVSRSADHTLRVWDLETGHCRKILERHSGSLALTADGRRAVSGSPDNTLRVWDLETGQCLKALKGHSSGVESVALTADGRRAVSGSNDNTLRVWDLETGECLETLAEYTCYVGPVALTADGRRAVSGDGNTLRVWDLKTSECLRAVEGHTSRVWSVAVTVDGRRAVSGSDDNTLRVWDLEAGQAPEGQSNSVQCVALTVDGRRAVSGDGLIGILYVWDLETGRCVKTLEGGTYGVRSVALTTDGRRAVSGEYETLRVWDLETGECLKTLEGHTDSVRSVAVTADGRRAISGSGGLEARDCTLRVWDLETGECLKTLEGHMDSVRSVAVTADGRRVVSGSEDNRLRFWDLETGQCLKTLEGHTDWVLSIALTADGCRAVSGSPDNTVRVWDLETGQCLKALEGHSSSVTSVALTADGRRAVSGSADNTVRVWDLETGQCLAVLPVDGLSTLSLGRVVVAGTGRGSVEVFCSSSPLLTGPPWITAVRVWRFGGDGAPGRWDDRLSVVCAWCGHAFPVEPPAGAGIPTSTAADIRCPARGCGQPLRLNPFVCDPLARASQDPSTYH